MPKVLVFGTFDRLHPGHQYLLTEAGKRGQLFVIVARDQNVQRIKGHASVQTENQRLESVKQAAPRADVRLGDPSDFLAPVRDIQPDLILFGYDQKLPPGVLETDFECKTERLDAFEPAKYKSSLL